MSGIFGVSYASHTFDQQIAAKKFADSFRTGISVEPLYFNFQDCLLGIVPRAIDTSYFLISDDNKYALAIMGTIYLPNGERLGQSNFQKDFLSPFIKSGGAFLRELSGGYCFALISDVQCILANDPFGNYMMHYSLNKESFAFSSSMMSLREFSHSSAFDDVGLLQHLCISQSLNGRTIFEAITRLNRGTMLTYSGGKLKSEEYISRRFHPSVNIRNELENIANELKNSINNIVHSGKEITAALSGGFDSRMTWSLILARDHNSKVTASTHGLPDSRDILISDRIAKNLNLRRDKLEFDRTLLSRLPELWREFVTLTDGLYPLSQIHSYYAGKHLSGRFDTLIDSYGGALYRRQIKKHVEPRIDPKKDIANQVLPFELTALASSTLLKGDVLEEMKIASTRGLKEYYQTIEEIPNFGDKFDLFYADQTVALRDSIGANLQANFIDIEQPLLNLKALEAVSRIPGNVRRSEGIHKYVIRHSYSKLEEFSLDYSGYPAPYRGFSTLRLFGPGSDRFLKIAGKFIPNLSSFSLRRPPMDARSILEPGLAMAKELLLSAHPSYDWIVDRVALEQTFNRMNSGDYNQAQSIIQLLTFRLMLDIFC